MDRTAKVLSVTYLKPGQAIQYSSEDVFDMARTDCSLWDHPDVPAWLDKMESLHGLIVTPNMRGWTFYRPMSSGDTE